MRRKAIVKGAVYAVPQYRDLIDVGICLKQLSVNNVYRDGYKRLDQGHNWIYIKERNVGFGRLKIYNNHRGGMIKNSGNTWIGMEYSCNKNDVLWEQEDDFIRGLAIEELERIGLAFEDDIVNITVQRMEKTSLL